mmetsp:Transcript_16622/g.45241  ORF Transcript_16622/g.45241 Transcript_16622/m.45241 type:complete len:203 (-) Transcript_16622:181-789(-)
MSFLFSTIKILLLVKVITKMVALATWSTNLQEVAIYNSNQIVIRGTQGRHCIGEHGEMVLPQVRKRQMPRKRYKNVFQHSMENFTESNRVESKFFNEIAKPIGKSKSPQQYHQASICRIIMVMAFHSNTKRVKCYTTIIMMISQSKSNNQSQKMMFTKPESEIEVIMKRKVVEFRRKESQYWLFRIPRSYYRIPTLVVLLKQ